MGLSGLDIGDYADDVGLDVIGSNLKGGEEAGCLVGVYMIAMTIDGFVVLRAIHFCSIPQFRGMRCVEI